MFQVWIFRLGWERLPSVAWESNSGSFFLFMGKHWLGLGHPLPFTPLSSLGPSGFLPFALLSPITDSWEGNSPLSFPCQPRDVCCSAGPLQFPPQPIPEGPNQFSLGVSSPATIFTGLTSVPGFKEEAGFAAWGRRAQRAPVLLRWWLCHHPALAQRSRDFDDASAPKTSIVQSAVPQTILLPSLAEMGLFSANLSSLFAGSDVLVAPGCGPCKASAASQGSTPLQKKKPASLVMGAGNGIM